MPRIRQYAEKYANEDFLKELSHRKVDCGIRTDKELGEMIGVCPSSMSKRKQRPETFAVGELRGLVRVLKPDPVVVLQFLGYSQKEIRKAALTGEEAGV